VSELLPSDTAVLDLLRDRPAMTVSQFADALGVTATAVRQRLTRLLARGHISRQTDSSGRGRPRHQYSLTAKGRQHVGTNFADLAVILWQEVRAVRDPAVQRGLLQRIAQRLASTYSKQIAGDTPSDRMEAIAQIFRERRLPFQVERDGDLPVLTALACPYPELADQDRSICAMERMMVSALLGEKVCLSQCRLDGATSCTFQMN
jgi:predicted ArsR family transcriptional regulator